MSLFPATALATIRDASDSAMVDTCAFSVPGSGGTITDDTGNASGPGPVSYSGACAVHDTMPRVALARGAAEGSPLAEATGWLRLPTVGDGIPEANAAAFRNAANALTGTATTRGLRLPFEGKGFEVRKTHSRLYVRFTGPTATA